MDVYGIKIDGVEYVRLLVNSDGEYGVKTVVNFYRRGDEYYCGTFHRFHDYFFRIKNETICRLIDAAINDRDSVPRYVMADAMYEFMGDDRKAVLVAEVLDSLSRPVNSQNCELSAVDGLPF